MTGTWWGWLKGDDDRFSGSYDFIESSPVWQTWGLPAGIAVVCIGLLWFFWPAVM
jgi:hypothetical protein